MESLPPKEITLPVNTGTFIPFPGNMLPQQGTFIFAPVAGRQLSIDKADSPEKPKFVVKDTSQLNLDFIPFISPSMEP